MPVNGQTESNAPISSGLEDQRRFLRNYWAHTIEGGFYMGGLAFLAANSVLPAMVKWLGGPIWVISLMPVMMMVASSWPSLLVAHRIDGLPYVKPYILITGIFQRLPYLLAALGLFFLSDISPFFVLLLVVITPFLSGALAGLNIAAWQGLIIKIIPERRRASSWAIRFIMGSTIGISAGFIIKWTLERFPGTTGFAILHLITFGFLTASYLTFTMIREMPFTDVKKDGARKLSENLKDIPAMIGSNPRIRNFVIMGMLTSGVFIMTPFLSLHALDVTGQPDSFLGMLVMAQMVGGIIGNIAAGYLGDRFGGKILLIAGRVLYLTVCVLAVSVSSAWAFLIVFALHDMAFFVNMVGQATLSLEICPVHRRMTYLSIMAAARIPAMLAASGLSTILKMITGRFEPTAWGAAVFVALSFFFLMRIPEPRKNATSGEALLCGKDYGKPAL